MVEEAPLEDVGVGLAPVGDGWFVVGSPASWNQLPWANPPEGA